MMSTLKAAVTEVLKHYYNRAVTEILQILL